MNRARLLGRGVSDGPHSGAWRRPVARLVWDQEVAGSNPAAPIASIDARRADGDKRPRRVAARSIVNAGIDEYRDGGRPT
jgi:hypothetical protein